MILLALACAAPEEPPRVHVQPPMAVVATVADDYSAGALALVSLDDLAVSDQLLPLGGDPQVVVLDGVVYLLERAAASSLTAWDPGDWSAPLWQVSVGTNPQDVALCGDQLFLSLYGEDHLEVRQPSSGLLLGEVDLSSFGDADGLPEASGLVVAGGRLYVAMHRFDRDDHWSPGEGVVVEVDCQVLEPGRTWTPGVAPDIFEHPTEPTSLVVRTGSWWQADGELSALHPDTGLDPAWLSEADLVGEDLLFFAGTPQGSLVVTASDSDPWFYAARCIDGAGALLGEAQVASALWGAEADDRGRVWTPARRSWDDLDTAGGLAVWDPGTCVVVGPHEWIQTALPPYDLDFVL